MSGVAVIRYLLVHYQPLLNVVPASRIMAGDLPLNTTLPAISVTQIGSTPRNTVGMNGAQVLHTDRVQVSVLVKGSQGSPAGQGYPGVRSLLKLVLAACPHQHGTINGVVTDSVLPDTEGPDACDETVALYTGSRDFIVKWQA